MPQDLWSRGVKPHVKGRLSDQALERLLKCSANGAITNRQTDRETHRTDVVLLSVFYFAII